jgi:phage terminase large subunit-like protein
LSRETSKNPHVQAGETYARRVIAGKISAGKWVRLACERHFRDKKRKDWNYKFVPGTAERVCRFVELFPHTKGKWAAKAEAFVLQPWQCFLLLSIFGWIHKAGPKKGKRRFTRALLLVPRKNGKSDLAARIGLHMFSNDGEFGAEVFSGATSEDQAWEVFRPARLMADRTPPFQEHFGVGVMKSNLHIIANGSRFEPIVGKPGDGASPSCAIIDEYHEHLDDTLFDAMETGMASREQPLCLVITTAGDNLSGPCYSLMKDLEKVLDGTTENERFWGVAYGMDPEDDWTTEASLRKANPNYGISVDPDRLLIKQQEAIRNARKQGAFLTKHGNVWVGARQAFFNMHSWHACAKPGIRPEDFKGCRLFIGFDLASTKDIAATPLLFDRGDGTFATFGRFYIPEAAIENGGNEHYAGWLKDGLMIMTDGNMIDYRKIEEDILELHSNFGITELAFDPAYAQRSVQGLMAEGVPCVELRPTVLNFSAPMKHLDGLILSGKIEHTGDPCFAWQMANVVSKTDQKDNVYPNKERPEAKIDGPVALIMAMARAMTYQGSDQFVEGSLLIV